MLEDASASVCVAIEAVELAGEILKADSPTVWQFEVKEFALVKYDLGTQIRYVGEQIKRERNMCEVLQLQVSAKVFEKAEAEILAVGESEV